MKRKITIAIETDESGKYCHETCRFQHEDGESCWLHNENLEWEDGDKEEVFDGHNKRCAACIAAEIQPSGKEGKNDNL